MAFPFLAVIFLVVTFVALVLLMRAPPHVRAAIVFNRRSFGARVFVWVAGPAAMLYVVSRVLAIRPPELLGTPLEALFGIALSLALCFRILWLRRHGPPQVPLSPDGRRFLTDATSGHLAGATLAPCVRLGARCLLVLVVGVVAGCALATANEVIGTGVACAAIGISLVGGGCRNQLDALVLGCALFGTGLWSLTALSDLAPTERGAPFSWLADGAIRWEALFADVAFTVAVSALVQRATCLAIMAYLLHIARQARATESKLNADEIRNKTQY